MDENVFYGLMFIIIALILTYLPFSPCCPWDCDKKNPCSTNEDEDEVENEDENEDENNSNNELENNNLLIPPKYKELINYTSIKQLPPPFIPRLQFKTHPPPYHI